MDNLGEDGKTLEIFVDISDFSTGNSQKHVDNGKTVFSDFFDFYERVGFTFPEWS